jgi:hypothetical protein
MTPASLDIEAQAILDLGAQRVECARSLVDLLTQAESEILKEIRLTETNLLESRKLLNSAIAREPPSAVPSVNEEHYCFCRGAMMGNMVNCENPACPFQWFHLECVGLRSIPPTSECWICPHCTALIIETDRVARPRRAADASDR